MLNGRQGPGASFVLATRHQDWLPEARLFLRQSFNSGMPCSLEVQRAPLLPKVLTLAGAEALLRKPFKSPHPTADSRSQVPRLHQLTRHISNGLSSFWLAQCSALRICVMCHMELANLFLLTPRLGGFTFWAMLCWL